MSKLVLIQGSLNQNSKTNSESNQSGYQIGIIHQMGPIT